MPRLGDSLASAAERAERLPLLVIYSLLHLTAFWVLANRKLLWDDEFFSLYISRAGFEGIDAALRTGADQHPPFFYWVTYSFLSLFGVDHVSVRLPAIVGTLLLGCALYRLFTARSSPIFGFAAALLAVNSLAFTYAYEARGYGLMLGFSGLAFLLWLRAGESERRLLTLTGLALSLAAAVLSHYYALAVLGPLGLGELVRSYQRRRVDVAVAIALAVPLVALACSSPYLAAAQGYSEHFWAKPYWRGAFSIYHSSIFYLASPLALACALLLLFHWRGVRHRPGAKFELPKAPEIAAIAGFCALPLLVFLAARWTGKGFHPRYVLPALIGFSSLAMYAALYVSAASRTVGLTLAASLLAALFVRVGINYWIQGNDLRNLRESIIFLDSQKPDSLPIAMAEVSPMHMMSFYAPERLADRLVYVSHPELAVKYLDHDTIDKGVLDLQPWFEPFKALPYQQFVGETDEFLVYGYLGSWSWLAYELPRDVRLNSEMVGRDHARLLLLTTKRDAASGVESYDRSSPRAIYRDVYLGKKLSAADWQTSFCSRWTGDEICRLRSHEGN